MLCIAYILSYVPKRRILIIGKPGYLKKPFFVPAILPFSVKEKIRVLGLDPRSEAHCLSLD
ncbi:AIS_collapsed_G0047620.mRNA.1.CDS.1 [Saccharomyces cerevisiae]|nr:AIS_HP1_G0047220.mRNA.1.CDS.1 [Saccharomyces cerevisiae]CAI6872635.1 AIS_collapsed_G0047620.mRNA.1.CDS.1 [Saccharomyces cerevisiae]